MRSVLGWEDVIEHVCTGLCEGRRQCCEGVGPPTTSRARPTMPNDICIIAACTSRLVKVNKANLLSVEQQS